MRLRAAPEGGAAEDPEAPVAVSPAFLRLLIAGRWVVIATVILTFFLPLRVEVNQPALAALGLTAILYNLCQWWLLRIGRGRLLRPGALIGIDLLLITLLDWFSGGIRSPFVDLFYLVIVIGAAFGDLRGSLATAVAVTALEIVLAILRPAIPGATWLLRLNFAINIIPYFFLTALASGYLVRRLREQWERREQAEAQVDAFRRELEIARELQEAFVHLQPPHLPGLALGARVTTEYGIGGDMLDYVPVRGGLVVAVADVAGHSLPAALVAARLTQKLEEAGLGVPLENVLDDWNRSIYERTPPEVFVTAVVVEVNLSDGRSRYAAAGHPPPILRRAATGEIRILEETGPALGVFADARFGLRDLSLHPGDVLLLYTDGAIEARAADGHFLGTEGLARLLRRHAGLAPQQIVDCITDDITAGYNVRDDMTLVAIARET